MSSLSVLWVFAALGQLLPASGAKPQPSRPTPLIVVLRRPGLRTYEQVAEEFRGSVRAKTRLAAVKPGGRTKLVRWLRRIQPDLVLAVGQTAYDAVRGSGLPRLLHAFVYHRQSAAHQGIHTRVAPLHIFKAFKVARPNLRTLTALVGPTTKALVTSARAAATKQGLRLVSLQASSPGKAISILRRAGSKIDALWLVADLDILTPQVVQYALGLQLRRRVPVMGATRRHAVRGVLFALDYDPTRVGRLAAGLASKLIGKPAAKLGRPRSAARRARGLYGSGKPRFTVNLRTAERIGADADRLKAIASEVIQ